MPFLAILFWILMVLAFIGVVVPFGPHSARINGTLLLVLLAIIGYYAVPLKL